MNSFIYYSYFTEIEVFIIVCFYANELTEAFVDIATTLS